MNEQSLKDSLTQALKEYQRSVAVISREKIIFLIFLLVLVTIKMEYYGARCRS